MEQRDLIKDQLELFGKAISKIFAEFLGFKHQGNTALGIEHANQQFITNLDIDIDKILSFSKQELSNYILEKKIPPPYLEMLIDYVIEMGKHTITTDKSKGINMLQQAQEMYKVLDTLSNTYSFERSQKEEEIKIYLQNN